MAKAKVNGPGPWCGTPGGYNNHGCRCALCLEAQRLDKRRYMAAHPEQKAKQRERRRGRWRKLHK